MCHDDECSRINNASVEIAVKRVNHVIDATSRYLNFVLNIILCRLQYSRRMKTAESRLESQQILCDACWQGVLEFRTVHEELESCNGV